MKTKRRSVKPSEEAQVRALAEWLIVRRLGSIKGIVDDVTAELDALTGQKFDLPLVLQNQAEIALLEVVKSFVYRSLIEGKKPQKFIDDLSSRLRSGT